jgi:hypothetical protein
VIESPVGIELLLPQETDWVQAKRIVFEAAAVSPYASIGRPVEVYFDERSQREPNVRIMIKVYVFDAQYDRRLRSDIVERAMRGLQNSRRRVNEDA